MKYLKTIAFIIPFLIFSCSKDTGDEVSNHVLEADFTYTSEIDKITLSDNSTYTGEATLNYEWSSNSDKIKLSSKNLKNTYFKIPDSAEDFEVTIQLIINDGIKADTSSKTIPVPGLNHLRAMGLGNEVIREKSNNPGYDLYIDQMNTGEHANDNCGPSVATMAIKWMNASFDKTAIDARNTYKPDGTWWLTSDIINYLNNYSIHNKTISLTNVELLVDEIEKGNLVIICLDMYYVRQVEENKEEWHIDKFYANSSTGAGHFLILKGYKETDLDFFFEVYDPNSYGKKYANGVLKGVDRYYRASDIDKSTGIWWDYAIVISRNSFSTKSKRVDVNAIEHAFGS